MKNINKQPSKSALIYLLLAIVFALMAIVLSGDQFQRALRPLFRSMLGVDPSWLFWLMILLAVCCGIPVIWTILSEFSARRVLPSFLTDLFSAERRLRLVATAMSFFGKMHTLGGRLAATGIAIFLLVLLLSNSNVIRTKEMNSVLYEFTSTLLGAKQTNPEEVPMVTFSLFTADNSQIEYLKDCLKIVHDLRSIGVKAVLIDFRNFLNKKQNVELMKKLEETGIVVFGLPYWYNFRIADSTGETIFTKARFTMSNYEVWQNPYLTRIRPAGYDYLGDEGLLDVTLELLRKYHNYPKDLSATRDGSEIVFGDYRIPVTSDGWMYSRERTGPPKQAPLQVSAHRGIDTDTLRYVGWTPNKGTIYPGNLEYFQDRLKAKIVFLQWNVYGGRLEESAVQRGYVVALQNILQNNFIREVEFGHPWFSLACLIFAGLIAYRVRPLASFILIFVLGVLIALLGAYLYDLHNLLVVIFYPLLSIVMSMFIFPSITVIEKMRIGEEAVES